MKGPARILAFCLGAFAVLNLIGLLRHGGIDANTWWIDTRPLPAAGGAILMAGAGLLLLGQALAPAMGTRRRRLTGLVLWCLIVLAVRDTLAVWGLFFTGVVHGTQYVPVSLVVVGVLFLLRFDLRRLAPEEPARWGPIGTCACIASLGLAFPLVQMAAFGSTDYRRPADVALVFGAGVQPDGTPSTALSDRVRTAVDLYHQGLVPRLLMSGGPGPGAVHEVEAMRTLAMALDVPAEAIHLDREGVSTEATVGNAVRDLASTERLLCVSHGYHLPRIKLTFQRAGREVFTVPARESRRLRAMPYYMLREVAAFWVYWGRGLG